MRFQKLFSFNQKIMDFFVSSSASSKDFRFPFHSIDSLLPMMINYLEIIKNLYDKRVTLRKDLYGPDFI